MTFLRGESKFQVGDRVVLEDETGRWEGEVTAVHPLSYTGFNFSVKWDSGVTELVNEEELANLHP